MTHVRKLTSLTLLGIMVLVSQGSAQESKKTLPNDISLELLGRCVLYSFSYQRTITPNFGIELGASLLGGSGASVTFFSVGARAYLLKGNASPCIAGGVVIVSGSTDSGPFSSSATGSYGYIGPGFEFRSDGGFLLRGTLYFLVHDGFLVWPGLQIGIAF